MSKSLFGHLFDHTDNCTRCDPSGFPLCPEGRALLDSATKLAGTLAAPIPDIPRSKVKA